MSGAVTMLAAAASAMVVSELLLSGTKLQTALPRVVVGWAAVYVGVVAWLEFRAHVDLVASAVLWGGLFLAWFGLRSHLESSILLRMLVLLRDQAMSERELVDRYTTLYGESMRLAELRRGGLVDASEPAAVTPKGRTVLRVVSKLR